jgi:hypothetical protein
MAQPNYMEYPRLVKPRFLITVDTEGDNLWSAPRPIETRNTQYLPRFQTLCEKYGFKPTWLTNYEMVSDPAFVEFGCDAVKRGTAEIGMHLHAWNSPPIEPLTSDDYRNQPFLIEYSEDLLRRKVAYLTALLEDKFGSKMTSHRAGRWALDSTYARVLAESGYRTDCSVTPCVSWQGELGDPAGSGGPDYSRFPDAAYFLDLDDIGQAGNSDLLELPMSIREVRPLGKLVPPEAARRLSNLRGVGRFFSRTVWLRPKGNNLSDMLGLLSRSLAEGRPYVEFMLHSSELMPGGSPYFPGAKDVETLYRDMEALFAAAAGNFEGSTLQEYRLTFARPAP